MKTVFAFSLCFPCPRGVGKPDACSFFLVFFFLENTRLFGIKLKLDEFSVYWH